MRSWRVSFDQKKRLVRALLKIHDLHNPEIRLLLLNEIHQSLGRKLSVAQHDNPDYALWALVAACADDREALRALVKVVGLFHEDHPAMADIGDILDELQPPLLTAVHRDALVHLIRDVPADNVAVAYRKVIGRTSMRDAAVNWQDAAAVVERVELAGSAEGGLPMVLLMVEQLAHGPVTAWLRRRMHEWILDVGNVGQLEITVVQALCPARMAIAERSVGGKAADQGNISLEFDPTPVSESDTPTTGVEDEAEPPGGAVNRATIASSVPTEQVAIWGGVPVRNPDFTGRDALIQTLRDALLMRSKASVLPQTLHGLGGVGKTQLAVEYVYRYADHYDLIWWVSADDPSSVRASLARLGGKLGLPASEDMQQTASAVLDALATSTRLYLLVYDNADDPGEIMSLVPSAGGHMILTSRNQEWTSVFEAIEVDVFDRDESIELLRKRSEDTISIADADRLAEKLGDLPLALEQAAGWQAATGMPVSRYLEQFDAHVEVLLGENKAPHYSNTVSASLSVAFENLRTGKVPAASQLFELFAFLGPEPISADLLRLGRGPDISSPLREALNNEIQMNRAIRELRRHGLVKVDPNGQRIQVHRLVQLVLREGLLQRRNERSQRNARLILATANPGHPDLRKNWPVHAELGPHIGPANLISDSAPESRQVALDQVRYLYIRGDYAGASSLGARLVEEWEREPDNGGLGPEHEQTIIAKRHLANAVRPLGEHEQARRLDESALQGLLSNPDFGDLHEHTVWVGFSLGADLRIAGDFVTAERGDRDNLNRAREVYGEEDSTTQVAKMNVAVSLRMLGHFGRAHDLDSEAVEGLRRAVGDAEPRTLWAVGNLARDLYGLGRYAEAWETQREVFPLARERQGANHSEVLQAARTMAIALRKMGRYGEALTQSRENYRAFHARFGPDNEHTLAATMTYANTLRTVGQIAEAKSLAVEAVDGYRKVFEPAHPLTLAASVNLGIILRAAQDVRQARSLDEATYGELRRVLGDEHPHTLCAATGLANSLVLDHELAEARKMTQRTLDLSVEVRGATHPYTLACAVNAALDRKVTGEKAAGEALLAETLDTMRQVLGTAHPEVEHASHERRAECDIEPPPT